METMPHPCVFIDATIADFRLAWSRPTESTTGGEPEDHAREKLTNELSSLFSAPNSVPSLPLLSVRSGFDLFLTVQRFPSNSRILMTAINIPDMVHIVRAHGLLPMPLDICCETFSPCLQNLEALIKTQRIVAVVVAHLFGRRLTQLDAIADVCTRCGIFFIEDCAELFTGFDYLGHPCADLVLFSFGVIKPVTCFGGAMAKFKRRSLYAAMREAYAGYPVQPHSVYARKVMKYFVLALFLNFPYISKCGLILFSLARSDHKRYFVSMLRGFPHDLLRNIRFRPPLSMLLLMEKKLGAVSALGGHVAFQTVRAKGDFFTYCLLRDVYLRHRIKVPGVTSRDDLLAPVSTRSYWLFPVLVLQPDLFVTMVNKMGVDAYKDATQVALIDAPEKSPCAAHFMSHVVFLPVQKNVPYSVLCEMIKRLKRAFQLMDSQGRLSKL